MQSSDEIEMVAHGLDHPEGPAFEAAGILWPGGEAGQIYRIDVESRIFEQVSSTNGFCLGLAFWPSDELFIGDLHRKSLLKMDRRAVISVIAANVNGTSPMTPNFCAFQSDGTLFLSDSEEFHRGNGRVYWFPQSGPAMLFVDQLLFANGLALSPDESWLYVVENNGDRVTRIAVQADKTAGRREIYATGLKRVPDGLAFHQAVSR